MSSAERPVQTAAVVLVLGLGWVLWPVSTSVALAGVIATIARTPYERLVVVARGRRAPVAAALTAAVTLAVCLPAWAVSYLTLGEATQSAYRLRSWFESHGGLEGLRALLPSSARSFLPDMEGVVSTLSSWGGQLAGWATHLVSSTSWWLAQLFLTVVTLSYLLKDGPELARRITAVAPLAPTQTGRLFEEFHLVAVGLFWGGTITCLFHGVAGAMGYALFGVDDIVLLSVLTALASLIPLVGTAIVWLPVVGNLFLDGHPYWAAGLAAWCVVVVGSGEYLVRPLVSKGTMALPRPLLYLTLFGGLKLLGPKGILLGPLIGSLAVVTLPMLGPRVHAPPLSVAGVGQEDPAPASGLNRE
jgi:predicted PurR-regulated permease PerM